MFFNSLIFSFIIYKCVGVIIILVWSKQSRSSSFIIVKAWKCLQMKATLLAVLSIGTITKSSLRENSVFNFMFIENRFCWSTCYFIFKGTIFSIYWLCNMTFPFWEMVLVDAFVIWYSLNELLNTSQYFVTSFKTNLFWFSILWAFECELPWFLKS